MSDYEQIGGAILRCGDCAALIPYYMQDVDCVLTDPPYGIGYTSGWATDDLWSEDAIRGDEDVVIRDVALGLLPPLMPKLVFGSRKAPLPAGCRMVLTWDKGPALGMGDLALPWKPSTEEIYVLGRGFVGKRDEGSVIYHPPVQSMAKNGRRHPNEKPVGLLAKLMRKLPNGTLGDPFMGSGSAGEACMKSGRPFIGFEADPEYFRIACERLHAVWAQRDFLEGVA